MKNRLSAFLAFVLFAVAALGVAFSNAPATNAQAPAFDPILLTPSKLIERAPAEFDAKFVTTKGEFTVRVTREWAPRGADRFYNLVKHHYFDACPFFRVISGFMAQFGLTPYPEVNKAWMNANIQDDPVKASNTRGKMSFAMAGPNTRSTQLFINFANRNAQLDKSGFAPIGEVSSGMEVVDKLNSEYGDHADQEKITMEGGAFLKRAMPHLDYMNTVRLVAAPAAGGGR
ncbi:MAG TPA: peptidylprolyl isomerase [Candidatus Acidoferrum sp.]|nr:peptidylprolyl isomerase [Candidatus Acidoferrum sp.]